MNDKTKKKK